MPDDKKVTFANQKSRSSVGRLGSSGYIKVFPSSDATRKQAQSKSAPKRDKRS
jgi:hypothetical protein